MSSVNKSNDKPIDPPFPYFGGKSTVASVVWERFGAVKQYVEPFFGTGAVAFRAPVRPRLEVFNDINCYVANFWRAVKYQPDAVVEYCDLPVVHIELTARHRWLTEPERIQSLRDALMDPEWPGDPQIAGWWVWGQCSWIGDRWCARESATNERIPYLGKGQGVLASDVRGSIDGPRRAARVIAALSARLDRVTVLNADWTRALNHSYGVVDGGTTAMFFDPPYKKFESIYRHRTPVAAAVEEWVRERGESENLRIALCGHVGDYDLPGWSVVKWKRAGATYNSKKPRDVEAIWFSPGCLPGVDE